MIDSFRLCLALGPLAIYVLLVGLVNSLRHPVVVSGRRDTAALGLALSGLVIIGPVELLVPVSALLRFGSFVWVLLVALYGLCLVLILLASRPRLVIYNISVDELRPVLAEVAARLDPEARWAADSLVLPGLAVQLHLDSFPVLRNVSLVAIGPNQNQQGWRQLELALNGALRQLEVGPNRLVAASLISGAALVVLAIASTIARDPQAVAQALLDMLRL